MRYATGDAFRTALETRINSIAHGDAATLTRLRRMATFDRFLARLLTVAVDRWLIKGGYALDLRLVDRARHTRDLDLARLNEENAFDDLVTATAVDLDDFFDFTVRRTDALDADDELATRFSLTAELASRRFENVIVDVGLGDSFPETPDILSGHDLLAFAGIAPITIPALPLDSTSRRNSTLIRATTDPTGSIPVSRI